MQISIIGLGVMGRAAAERLVAAGHEVIAFDPAPIVGRSRSGSPGSTTMTRFV